MNQPATNASAKIVGSCGHEYTFRSEVRNTKSFTAQLAREVAAAEKYGCKSCRRKTAEKQQANSTRHKLKKLVRESWPPHTCFSISLLPDSPTWIGILNVGGRSSFEAKAGTPHLVFEDLMRQYRATIAVPHERESGAA